MTLPREIITPRDKHHGSRLGDIMRRLTSANDGELAAAVHAMRRLLESVSADIHDLVELLETSSNGNGVSAAELEMVWRNGCAKGIEDAENKQHCGNDFRNTDGKPDWDAVALFVQRNKDRIDPRHHDFIDDMAAAPRLGANQPRNSTNTCTACSSNSAGGSHHERASRRDGGSPVRRDHSCKRGASTEQQKQMADATTQAVTAELEERGAGFNDIQH